MSGLFSIIRNGKYGFIDKTGQIVINPQFKFAWSFSEGLAAVEIGDKQAILGGKWGYIDKTGKYVINPQFDEAWEFMYGHAMVKIGGKIGTIDKTGKYQN